MDFHLVTAWYGVTSVNCLNIRDRRYRSYRLILIPFKSYTEPRQGNFSSASIILDNTKPSRPNKTAQLVDILLTILFVIQPIVLETIIYAIIFIDQFLSC